jgi:hypothetical protein
MRNILRKFDSFNESLDMTKEQLLKERDEFCDSVIDTYHNGFYSPYSSIVLYDLIRGQEEPITHFDSFQEDMDGFDFNLEKIKKIFCKEADEICGSSIIDNINRRHLDNCSGSVDLYLYFLLEKLGYDKNEVVLGGAGWSFSKKKSYADFPLSEYAIRYEYGYHKSKYGLLMLEQMGLTVEEFEQKSIDLPKQYLFEEWKKCYFDYISLVQDKELFKKLVKDKDLEKQIVIRPKRVIYLTESIADLLNEIMEELGTNRTFTGRVITNKLSFILEELEYIGSYDFVRRDHEFIVNGNIPTNE